MTWLARLKEKISETPGGTVAAKGAKGALATLATASPPCIPEKKPDPENRKIEPDFDETSEAIQEHLEERAAIMEYDGGLTRKQAETKARRNMRVYQYRLTDSPESRLIMIAPGCDLEEARENLCKRFGDRLLDVCPQN